MQPRLGSNHLPARAVLLGVLVIGLGPLACTKPTPATEPDAAVRDAAAAGSGASEADIGGLGSTRTELPSELLAELRLRGSGADGRLLTLAPSFIATAECSDCGAPSYLRFLAVRCSDSRHCEILSEQCEGAIRREGETFEVELRPVNEEAAGAAGEGAELCAGYSGTFERP
jgi:hypothetical protein